MPLVFGASLESIPSHNKMVSREKNNNTFYTNKGNMCYQLGGLLYDLGRNSFFVIFFCCTKRNRNDTIIGYRRNDNVPKTHF